jgi:hypothetical protein
MAMSKQVEMFAVVDLPTPEEVERLRHEHPQWSRRRLDKELRRPVRMRYVITEGNAEPLVIELPR